MNLKPTRGFLTRCFSPAETIALLLRSEARDKVTQRIVTLESALAPRYLAGLGHENGRGANIYVAANPLRPGSRKRSKESIASLSMSKHITKGSGHIEELRLSNDNIGQNPFLITAGTIGR
jgi:hypothetical protein